ncbi:MAG: hypothetical protein KF819_05325 [Labilithrix sp.]|nr:hypothetical protein [Labilithrix sp.]
MNRRALFFAVSAFAWLGCNALLGNESAVFAPDAGDGATIADDGGADASNRDADVDGGDGGDGATPCVDLASNPRHCGACNHDCFSGACVSGSCQPYAIAIETGTPIALTIDATHAYWTNDATGDVKRAPLGGGAAEVIYDGADDTPLGGGIVRFGAHVYFTIALPAASGGGVFRCPATGCGGAAPQAVVAPLESPAFIGLAGADTLLVTEFVFDGRVGRCTLPCASGALDVIAPAEGFPKLVTVDGDAYYWSSLLPGPGAVRWRENATSSPTTLIPGLTVEQVAVVGDEVLFAQRGSGVKAAPRDGGAIRRIYEPFTQTERFALDDGGIYFNESLDVGRIVRCPLFGCADAGTSVAINQIRPYTIVVDDKRVFWINQGKDNAGGGVHAIAK